MSRKTILTYPLAAMLVSACGNGNPSSESIAAKAGAQAETLEWSGVATVENCRAETAAGALQGHPLDLAVEQGLYLRQKMQAQFELRAADGRTPLVLKLVRGERYASAWPDASGAATTLEMLDPPAGAYTVAVCALGAPAGTPVPYAGTLRLSPKAAPVPPPSADPQGLEFSASLINDLQRDEGEPIIEIDNDGIVYTCGPTGSSQGQDYAQVSLDSGDQFNILGAYPRGQFSAGGGGDCALATAPVRNDQGYFPLAYSGLSNLITFTTATSPDRGASFLVSPTSSAPPAVDRQWLAFSDGDTVFHSYNKTQPRAITVQRSDDGGLTYGAETTVSPAPDFPGQIRTLPAELNPAKNGKPAVYYPWSQGNYLRFAVSLDEGASWNNCTLLKGRGSVSNQFPVADHDRAGNIYVVYTEDSQFQTYVTAFAPSELLNCKGGTAGDFGKSPIAALPPVQANRDKAVSTVFPWIAAGGEPGRVAVTFYGSEVAGRPDNAELPHAWHVYVSQSLNVLDADATFAQVRATTRPMHYDQICLQGLGCTTGGDRSLVDFYAMDLNPKNGELVVVYNWAHKRPGDSGGLTSTPVVTRQIAGPSNLGGFVEPNGRSVLRTYTEDPLGDAYTDFSRLFVAGQRGSTLALDVSAVEVGPAIDLDTGAPLPEGGFTVTMQILDLGQIPLEDGLLEVPAQSLLWVFYYVDGYRHHAAVASWTEAGFVFGHNGYVGSAHECGTPSTGEDEPNGLPAGSPDQCMYYPGDTPIQGKADKDTGIIQMTVPLSLIKALREVPAPARSPAEVPAQPGDRIHSAAVYTFGNPVSPVQSLQSWLAPADNTAAMDFLIPGSPAAPAQTLAPRKEGQGLFLGALPAGLLALLALGALLRARLRLRPALIGMLALAICGCGNSVPALNGGKELAAAGAVVGPSLAQKMTTMAAGDTLEVIVSFHGKEPVSAAQAQSLRDLGMKGLFFRHLPIAGVVATRTQIEQLRQRADVRSLWHNDTLVYDDEQARYLTSVDQAQRQPELVNAAGEPITGKGVTILVNDSGVDGLHPDLLNKVVANAIGHTDLRGVSENQMLPATPTECPGPCNSDFGGSHGTHVAGIAAGDGTISNGKYAGAAKGASLAAYGSGATLLVLSTIGGFDYALHLLETRPEINLRIVTNSFGTTGDQATKFDPNDPTNIATKILADRNMIVVFSAGNSGSGPSSITGNYKKAPWILIAGNGEKSGLLAPSSSRGALVDAVYEVSVDGEKMTVEDRPTVVTPGTNIVSARAVAADPFLPLDAADDAQSEIPPQLVPFYTHKTGTSMAAPHLAGLTALLLEANPKLGWRELKPIFKATATNMPGYDVWEAGAGYANIEAALATALGLRDDYGAPNHAARTFNAGFPAGGIVYDKRHAVEYLPAGLDTPAEFEVSPDIALVIAIWERPNTTTCTCSIYLVDPNGIERAASGVGLPVLAPRVAAVATGRPGKWKLRVRGLRSASGVSTDPTGAGFGSSAPATIEVQLQLLAFDPAYGLGDIAGHPAQLAIEAAVRERLMDGLPGGFRPDQALTRAQFAEYLMAWGVRQTRAHRRDSGFPDLASGTAIEQGAAEAVTRGGQLIMDGSSVSQPLMPWVGTTFEPSAPVTREQVAYGLVQAIGRQSQALAHGNADLVAVDENGQSVPVADAAEVDPALRAHVQEAIQLKLLDVEFFSDGGTRKARVRPQTPVTRADYASAAARSFTAVPFP